MVVLSVILALISIVIIYRASEWVIRYSVSLSKLLGISTFVIGFILIAVSTSLPELFVTIFATLSGEATLAAADILGSNIFDLNIGIGLVVLMAGTIYVKRKETLHLIELLFITTAITLILFTQTTVNFIHGIVLLLLGGYMLLKLYKGGKVERKVFEDGEIPLLPKRKKGVSSFFHKQSLGMISLKFGISVFLLIAATKILVDASLDIAGVFGLTSAFVGATMVAIGTSLPEVAVTYMAVKKKEYALAMGDIIGTTAVNITLILGILMVLNVGPLAIVSLAGMVPYLILSTLVVWYSVSHTGKIAKDQALLLLLIYAGFLLEQLGLISIFG